LGNTLKELGKLEDAETSYKKAIAIKPEYAENLSHAIASISGLNPARATNAYVSNLFDDYAKKFESSLVEDLNYKTPTLIANFLLPLVSSENPNFDILDLGCGTGLAGDALIGLARTLVGVDLSKEMLKIAEAKIFIPDLFKMIFIMRLVKSVVLVLILLFRAMFLFILEILKPSLIKFMTY
jgi:predicted TPR repeat methyltransferase